MSFSGCEWQPQTNAEHIITRRSTSFDYAWLMHHWGKNSASCPLVGSRDSNPKHKAWKASRSKLRRTSVSATEHRNLEWWFVINVVILDPRLSKVRDNNPWSTTNSIGPCIQCQCQVFYPGFTKFQVDLGSNLTLCSQPFLVSVPNKSGMNTPIKRVRVQNGPQSQAQFFKSLGLDMTWDWHGTISA